MNRAFWIAAVTLLMNPSALAQMPLDGWLLRHHPTYGLYNSMSGQTIVWPAGTYEVYPDVYNLGEAFFLKDNLPYGQHARSNLTIDATGVTIVIKDPTIGVFRLVNCHGIKIKGLTVKYDPVPYNQSTVVAVDTGTHTFDVVLDAGYLAFEDAAFGYGPLEDQEEALGRVSWGTLFDPATTLLKAGTDKNHMIIDSYMYLGLTSLGLKKYRLTLNYLSFSFLDSNPIDIELGDRLVYVIRPSRGATFALFGCEPTGLPLNRPPVTIEDCTVEAGGWCFAFLDGCPRDSATGQSVIRNCTVTNGTTPGRLPSICGNSLRMGNNRIGPLVENSTFERMLDDASELYVSGRLFTGYYPGAGYGDLVADFDSGAPLEVGDTLQLMAPATGEVRTATIANILDNYSSPRGGPRRVWFSQPVHDLEVGVDVNTSTHAYNLNLANPGFVIRNNTFGKNRGDGAVLTTSGGLYENNVIDSSAQHGIVVANIYSYGRAGPVPTGGVTIRNNTVRNCGYVYDPTNPMNGSSILIGGMASLFLQPATVQSAEDIFLEGNRIENWNTCGIYAVGLKDSFIVPYLGTHHTFNGFVDAVDRAVYIAYPAGNTIIDGIATGASGLDYAVTIDFGVDADVTATNIGVTPPTLPLEDLR